jgi:hypothetical protein
VKPVLLAESTGVLTRGSSRARLVFQRIPAP